MKSRRNKSMTFGSLKARPVMAAASWTGSVDLYPVTQDTPERGRRHSRRVR